MYICMSIHEYYGAEVLVTWIVHLIIYANVLCKKHNLYSIKYYHIYFLCYFLHLTHKGSVYDVCKLQLLINLYVEMIKLNTKQTVFLYSVINPEKNHTNIYQKWNILWKNSRPYHIALYLKQL